VVGDVQAQAAELSLSLSHLQSISIVSLGLTAFVPVLLGCQFFALSRRLTTLQKQVAHLHRKFDAAMTARLRAGLDLLRQGQDMLEAKDRAASNRLHAALPLCIESMKFFGELLGNELNDPKAGRDGVHLLSRHLCVALMAVASAQISLEHDQHAFGQSRNELDLLCRASTWLFEPIARDPGTYLLPSMREHGVTIEFMAELFQQASAAGVPNLPSEASVSAWFEHYRQAIVQVRSPWTWRKPQHERLKATLQQALAAVEETNRAVSLSAMLDNAQASVWRKSDRKSAKRVKIERWISRAYYSGRWTRRGVAALPTDQSRFTFGTFLATFQVFDSRPIGVG
jgi:hypothetical protein